MPASYGEPATPQEFQPSGKESPSAGMRDKSMHASGGTLHIGPDMLPEGMKLNRGDIVEFKVIGEQDADGDWPIEYNYGEGGEGKGEEGGGKEGGESWEEGLMKHMSPRSGGDEGSQSAY